MNLEITVKAARVNARLTKKEVAEKLSLSVSGYTLKEEGKRRFYVDEAVELSQMLGLPLDYFFNRECHKKTRNDQGGENQRCI